MSRAGYDPGDSSHSPGAVAQTRLPIAQPGRRCSSGDHTPTTDLLRNANDAAAVTDPPHRTVPKPRGVFPSPRVVAGTKLWGQLTPWAESPARLARGRYGRDHRPTEAGSYPSGITCNRRAPKALTGRQPLRRLPCGSRWGRCPSASSSRRITSSLPIRSSRAWLAVCQSGSVIALTSSAWASPCSSGVIRLGPPILAPSSSSLWSLPSIFWVIANDQVMADDLDDLDGPKATRSRRRGRERKPRKTIGVTIKQ